MAKSNEAKIDITAEDKNTSAVFGKVAGGLQGLDTKAGLVSKSFGDIGASVARLGAFAGFAVAAAGLANFVTGAVEAAGKVQDLKEITGGTANGLSAIANEAETAGVSIDDVSSAMVKLSRNLASQDEQSGKTAKALGAIGLSAKEIKALSPDEAFFAISKALAGFADGASKSAVISEIFGKSAANLIPLMNDLAERTKLVGTVTDEQAKAADDLDKAWKETKQSVTLAGQAIGRFLLPALSQTTQIIRESQKEYGGFLGFLAGIPTALAALVGLTDADKILSPLKRVDAQVNETFTKLTEARKRYEEEASAPRADSTALEAGRQARIKAEAKNVADLSAQLKGLIVERNKLSEADKAKDAPKKKLGFDIGGDEAADKAKASYDALVKTIKEKIAANNAEIEAGRALNSAEQERAKMIADIEAGLVKLTPERDKHIRALLDEQVATEAGTEGQKAALKLYDEQQKALDDLRGAEEKRNRAVEEAQRTRLAELKDPDAERRNKLQADIDLLQKSMERGETTADEYAKSIMALTGQTAQKDISAWAQAGATGIEAFSTALAKTAISGKNDWKSFSDSFVQELENMIIQILIIKPLLKSLGEGLGGSEKGSANDGIWAQVGTALLQSYGGGKAVGGSVSSGSFYEVNERGPELYQKGGKTYLMTGGADANIVPLQTSANAPAATQNVRVSIENKGTSQQIKSAEPQFDSHGMVVRIVLDDIERGGPLRTAIANRG